MCNSVGMDPFTPAERAYLREQRLARVATVGRDGTPHVTPVGFAVNEALGTVDVTGMAIERTKKFRDVQRAGRAAVVVDDLPSVDPWRVRGVEVRGRAEALAGVIRIFPERIRSWGIEDDDFTRSHARDVSSR
jgi:pyridoxamine 5'-phosphate oxidase family protein